MPLYGHELNEETNPLEAGLGFAVNLEGRSFPGSEALATVKRDKPKRVRIGLELSGKRPAREHYAIFAGGAGGKQIGEITSGTFSPTLQKPIAMGYVPPEFQRRGNRVDGRHSWNARGGAGCEITILSAGVVTGFRID